jgi:hypothetical protein
LWDIAFVAVEVYLRNGGEVPVIATTDLVSDESGNGNGELASICWAGFEEENSDEGIF